MPTFIVKPERDRDLYVAWSSVVDAPTGFGSRSELADVMQSRGEDASPERFDRADAHGSSARFGKPVAYGWGDEAFIVHEVPGGPALIRRDRMVAWLEAGCPADMLDPIEED